MTDTKPPTTVAQDVAALRAVVDGKHAQNESPAEVLAAHELPAMFRRAALGVVDAQATVYEYCADQLERSLAAGKVDKRTPIAWAEDCDYGRGYSFAEEFFEAFPTFPNPPADPAKASEPADDPAEAAYLESLADDPALDGWAPEPCRKRSQPVQETAEAKSSGSAPCMQNLYDAAAKGFHTSESCGPDGEYMHVSKFKTLQDLQDFHRAWTDAMVSVRDATPPASPVVEKPAYWEWRFFNGHPHTVDFGNWSEWERVIPRGCGSLEDRLNELREYISSGKKYQLRALFGRLMCHSVAAELDGPAAYCRDCQAVGMSNCSEFDKCSGATCVTCHRPFNAATPPASAPEPAGRFNKIAAALMPFCRGNVSTAQMARAVMDVIGEEASAPEVTEEMVERAARQMIRDRYPMTSFVELDRRMEFEPTRGLWLRRARAALTAALQQQEGKSHG